LKDLVVDGSTPAEALTIAVLSIPKGYEAQIIRKRGKIIPENIIDIDENCSITRGLNHFLEFNRDIRSEHPTYIFTIQYKQILTPDGRLIDPAVIEYYYRSGKFVAEIEDD